MSLIKLFNRIFWHNNTTPAINEDNLNSMSKAIDDIDDRVIELGDDILEKVPQIEDYLDRAEDLVDQMEELSKNPPYIGANGNWYVWNTETEQYEDSHVDASITVTIADITMIATTAAPYVTNTGTNTDPIFHLYIPKGKELVSITKTATSGLEDTYTISYSDGTSTTFNVTNGNGISTIAKTSTLGLVDTYTITMDNGTTATFNVTNGRGIVSITKTETVGYTDTYTITYNDGTTSEFYVHNGKSGSGSNITVSTNDPELFGRPVTITDQYQRTETQDFNSSGLTRFDSLEMDGQITISSTTAGGYTATSNLTLTYFGNYSAQLSLWRAVVEITGSSELYGAIVVVKDSNNVTVGTLTLSAIDGTGTYQTFEPGTYTFNFTYDGDSYSQELAITSNTTYTLDLSPIKLVSWSSGSDADIKAMVDAYYAGKLTLEKIQSVWSIGDERVVRLSAITGVNVGENQSEQNVSFVIMNWGGKKLASNVNALAIVGQKNSLATAGKIHATTVSVGWNDCSRRSWCNQEYKNAIPSAFRSLFKQFHNYTGKADPNFSTVQDSLDYFAFPSEVEVFGTAQYANATAEGYNEQFEYYETAVNRIKKMGNNANNWWERSPSAYNGMGARCCHVKWDGTPNYMYVSDNAGLAPFGCI